MKNPCKRKEPAALREAWASVGAEAVGRGAAEAEEVNGETLIRFKHNHTIQVKSNYYRHGRSSSSF
jgi:hypothetical protein